VVRGPPPGGRDESLTLTRRGDLRLVTHDDWKIAFGATHDLASATNIGGQSRVYRDLNRSGSLG
jgi:hypothetical protein